jgi:hypothetical protein
MRASIKRPVCVVNSSLHAVFGAWKSICARVVFLKTLELLWLKQLASGACANVFIRLKMLYSDESISRWFQARPMHVAEGAQGTMQPAVICGVNHLILYRSRN